VDNTITPLAVSPLTLGADIAVYSTTKIISGNAAALGGAAVFRKILTEDKFRSERYKALHPFIEKAGEIALIANAKKKVLRDFGMSANAFASYLTLLGLETLPLRMERIAETVERVALALSQSGLRVNHPVLASHPDHALYGTAFSKGCGTLLTLDFGSREKAFDFLRKTRLATITANIGDSRTLALHMASTIYRDFDEKALAFLGITPGLVRISIGLESASDIINDFVQAAR
jgi:O-acetylhomoserine (thiol)-lyase